MIFEFEENNGVVRYPSPADENDITKRLEEGVTRFINMYRQRDTNELKMLFESFRSNNTRSAQIIRVTEKNLFDNILRGNPDGVLFHCTRYTREDLAMHIFCDSEDTTAAFMKLVDNYDQEKQMCFFFSIDMQADDMVFYHMLKLELL